MQHAFLIALNIHNTSSLPFFQILSHIQDVENMTAQKNFQFLRRHLKISLFELSISEVKNAIFK